MAEEKAKTGTAAVIEAHQKFKAQVGKISVGEFTVDEFMLVQQLLSVAFTAPRDIFAKQQMDLYAKVDQLATRGGGCG